VSNKLRASVASSTRGTGVSTLTGPSRAPAAAAATAAPRNRQPPAAALAAATVAVSHALVVAGVVDGGVQARCVGLDDLVHVLSDEGRGGTRLRRRGGGQEGRRNKGKEDGGGSRGRRPGAHQLQGRRRPVQPQHRRTAPAQTDALYTRARQRSSPPARHRRHHHPAVGLLPLCCPPACPSAAHVHVYAARTVGWMWSRRRCEFFEKHGSVILCRSETAMRAARMDQSGWYVEE